MAGPRDAGCALGRDALAMTTPQKSELGEGFAGTLTWRGDERYEDKRRRTIWNRRTPPRFPDLIVEVASAADVAAAVRLADALDLRVAVRGAGHSFCGSPLRDGGMLIDVSRLRELRVDPGSRTAIAGPGVTGRELATALARHGLGFPVAHAGCVPLSGYLLCGGFGWNMGAWGPACFSVRAVDVVTAAGEIVHAGPDGDSELLWAARGAGPGFFGVVTRFELDAHALPSVIRSSTYLYPPAALPAVAAWASQLAPALPGSVEMLIFLARTPAPVVGVTATAFVDDDGEAQSLLARLDTCPALDSALHREAAQPTSIPELQDKLETLLPAEHRYAVDTQWCDDELDDVLPTLAGQIADAPSARSIVIAVPVPRDRAPIPDAAFSMAGRTDLMCYAVWTDERDDEANERWLRDTMRSVDSRAVGHYIAEVDLEADPTRATRCFAPPNWERLESLRAVYDPGGRFHSYLGLEAAARRVEDQWSP